MLMFCCLNLQRIDIGGTLESVVKGGKHLYPDVAKAFEACGVKKVTLFDCHLHCPPTLP